MVFAGTDWWMVTRGDRETGNNLHCYGLKRDTVNDCNKILTFDFKGMWNVLVQNKKARNWFTKEPTV